MSNAKSILIFFSCFFTGSTNTSTAGPSNSNRLQVSKSVRQAQSGAASNPLPQPSLVSTQSKPGSNQSQGASGGSGAAPNSFPEPLINRLMKFGSSRQDVIAALTEANGEEAKAQMILFAKSLKM